MVFQLFVLLVFSFSALAQGTVSFRNDREGGSYYQSKSTDKAIQRALKAIPSEEIFNSFKETLNEMPENKLCAYDFNARLNLRLLYKNVKFEEYEGAIHHIRSKNEIDDVVVKILLDAYETENTQISLPKRGEWLVLPSDDKKVDEMIKLIATFKEKFLKGNCFDEAYKNLHGELTKIYPSLTSSHLEAIFVEGHERKVLNIRAYLMLERARDRSLEQEQLNLKNYYSKLKSLRVQYPLKNPNEKSEFITDSFDKKSAISRRQKLLEQYSDIQIILMGNIIKKLRSRIESPKVEILVYDKHELQETIPLEPMERFRFALKVLRKEMSHLSLNTYFGGRSPDYIDLMSAAYEIGLIPATELEEVATLQDIWNPKKTLWEKAGIWVKTFSTMTVLVLPPGIGFLPTLAIVVIEATIGKKETRDETTSLF